MKKDEKIEVVLLKFLKIKIYEGKLIITNLFEVLFILITLVLPMGI